MIRPRHPFVALIFSLLLVAMQYGAQLHALEHVGDTLRQTPEHSLTAPRDEICALCALFASGANAISSDQVAAHAVPDAGAVSLRPLLSVAAAAPSYYSSRAPPSLL
jgi:hypothetical protein